MRSVLVGAIGWGVALGGCASSGGAPEMIMMPTLVLESAALPAIEEVPVPDYYRQAESGGTRSTSGAPGDGYWQNDVAYQIQAELDPSNALIRGAERIVYRNSSPDSLLSIVLNLYQNIFTESVPRNRYAPVTGGMTLERVVAQGATLPRRTTAEIPIVSEVRVAPAGYSVQGTLGRVRLPEPVAPGDSVILEIEWQHRIPPAGGFRTAWEDALGSRAFLVAQWYPQIAVYDDLKGWDATPYLGDGEFYLEYGDFDVEITVPAGFLVGATGDLLNGDEVLTPEAQARLSAAGLTDSVTHVVTEADLTAGNTTQSDTGGQLTWRFSAEGVRDFAWATSPGYVWDASSVRVGEGAGTRVTVHALYRPGAPHWERGVEFGQHATRVISEGVVDYPYPQITIAEGSIGGMEYPMMIFIPKPSAETSLYAVIAHEIAHEWFPMLVGQDEAAFAWMDEGSATYLEALAVGDFYGVEDPHELDRESYLDVAGGDTEVSMMVHTDLVSPYGARIVAAYFKPATLLRSLSALLGQDVFREALRTYTGELANRHPTPWDFFRTLERVSGRSLGWFFRPWWFDTAELDHGITSVTRGLDGRTEVEIEKIGEAMAPALVVGTTGSGERVTATLEGEWWLTGAESGTVTLESAAPFTRVELDPEHFFPDSNPLNDVWQAGAP